MYLIKMSSSAYTFEMQLRFLFYFTAPYSQNALLILILKRVCITANLLQKWLSLAPKTNLKRGAIIEEVNFGKSRTIIELLGRTSLLLQ